jgi:hypothetical protein
MAKSISVACTNTLKDIIEKYVNRNLSLDANYTFKSKYVTNNMFRKISSKATYMDAVGNITNNANNATIVTYIFNGNDGLLNTSNSSYGKLKLIAFDEKTALTSIEHTTGGVATTYYPVFIKDGDNWKLEAY